MEMDFDKIARSLIKGTLYREDDLEIVKHDELLVLVRDRLGFEVAVDNTKKVYFMDPESNIARKVIRVLEGFGYNFDKSMKDIPHEMNMYVRDMDW